MVLAGNPLWVFLKTGNFGICLKTKSISEFLIFSTIQSLKERPIRARTSLQLRAINIDSLLPLLRQSL